MKKYFSLGLLLGIFSVVAMAAYVPFAITSGTNKMRIESAVIAGSSVNAGCTSTPCTVYTASTSGVFSAAHDSSGTYTVTIASGTFSAAPTCVCGVGRNAGLQAATCYSSSSTSTSVIMTNASNALQDEPFSMICMGPR